MAEYSEDISTRLNMSYENENETKTDWFEVAYLMTRCGMFGFGCTIFLQ